MSGGGAVMRLSDADPTIIVTRSGVATTRCLGRLPDGSDRDSAVEMARRLVAQGYTETRHPMERP